MASRLPPSLSVGYEEIDGQHRMLFRYIDAAADASERGELAAVKEALAELGDYFVAHFAVEESFMADASYPDRGKHKTAHDLFMQDFAQLSRELRTFGLTPLVRTWIEVRVPAWTRFHVEMNDLPLGRFLAARRFRPETSAASEKPRAS